MYFDLGIFRENKNTDEENHFLLFDPRDQKVIHKCYLLINSENN